jgi:hypothetical protein
VVSFTLGVRTSETPAVVVARLDRATQYAAAKRFKFSAPANYREYWITRLKRVMTT